VNLEQHLKQPTDGTANGSKSLSNAFSGAIEYMEQAGKINGLQSGFRRKQRNGAPGSVLLTFLGEIMRFESYAGSRPESKPKAPGRKGFEYQ
jgi:hypothetical protein